MRQHCPAPGFINHPEHRVRIAPSNQHWIVRDGETILADSCKTLLLEESGYEPVIYFPPTDVAMQQLVQTDDQSTCPFKGEANYFVHIAGEQQRPIAWTYRLVYSNVAFIQGYIAFYKDRVSLQDKPTQDR